MRIRLLSGMLVVGILAMRAVGASAPAVHVDTFVDTTAVRPGETFRVAVRLKVDPGWHVYWENAGDAGMATQVKVQVPMSHAAKLLGYPLPVKFIAGEIVGYGYTDEVVFLVEVRPQPESLTGSTLSVGINVSWLCCSDQVCVPGSAKLSLDVPMADAEKISTPANQEIFEKAKEALPAASPPADVAMVTAAASGIGVQVNWKQAVKDVEAYPLAADGLKVEAVKVETAGGHSTVALNARVYTGQTVRVNDLPVLIVYKDSEGRPRGFYSAVDLRPLAARQLK